MTTPISPNMLGAYGPWAADLLGDAPGSLSFRNDRWHDVEEWRPVARNGVAARYAPVPAPTPTVHKQYTLDGLHVEELSWQHPAGAPTQAVFLKPAGATGECRRPRSALSRWSRSSSAKEKITHTADHHRSWPVTRPTTTGIAPGPTNWRSKDTPSSYTMRSPLPAITSSWPTCPT
ncbi:MAG: hypothetical protein R2856_25230 [Caldilineaceae bacterium]